MSSSSAEYFLEDVSGCWFTILERGFYVCSGVNVLCAFRQIGPSLLGGFLRSLRAARREVVIVRTRRGFGAHAHRAPHR